MKSPHLVLMLLCFLCSCEDEEVSFTGVRCVINGERWTAENVFAYSSTGNEKQIARLVATDGRGFEIRFSFTALGLTASNKTADFRKRSASLNFFNYQIISDNTIRLDWETLSEENLHYFDVQYAYSEQGNYSTFTTVYAVGNSTTSQFYNTFFSLAPTEGQHVYIRLKLVDLDGDVAYSDPMPVRFIFPVSVRTAFGDNFEGYDGNVTITKYDFNNKLVSGTFHFQYRNTFNDEVRVIKGEIGNVQY